MAVLNGATRREQNVVAWLARRTVAKRHRATSTKVDG